MYMAKGSPPSLLEPSMSTLDLTTRGEQSINITARVNEQVAIVDQPSAIFDYDSGTPYDVLIAWLLFAVFYTLTNFARWRRAVENMLKDGCRAPGGSEAQLASDQQGPSGSDPPPAAQRQAGPESFLDNVRFVILVCIVLQHMFARQDAATSSVPNVQSYWGLSEHPHWMVAFGRVLPLDTSVAGPRRSLSPVPLSPLRLYGYTPTRTHLLTPSPPS